MAETHDEFARIEELEAQLAALKTQVAALEAELAKHRHRLQHQQVDRLGEYFAWSHPRVRGVRELTRALLGRRRSSKA
ncbi:hypothetical protein [Nocardioides limicola]|uniref:hypothetical protein n=1 Tax=Nocardioides limicola TaxID=2803368 RepID=UPI00193C426D|nr:hypothetical protein [Nocardioides sp. DJM-14]